ncbi:MAG: hypothetical protein IIV91_04165 [Alistipes sp.]|nr:hypothetical protein [Alistipes sp.]
MIKNLLKMFICATLVCSIAVACGDSAGTDDNGGGNQEQPSDPQEPENPDEPQEPENPENPDDPQQPADPSEQTPVDIYPGIPTKVVCYENKVTASNEGVSLEVTRIENNNFVFVARPGEFVQSYRLDVFPLCRLYNALFEQMLTEGKSEASARDIDTWIRDFVFNSTGAGAYTFDSETHADYAAKEFDWMNTSYAQAYIVPDAEYVIVAVACYDKAGTDDGEMSVCYVRTTSDSLIGNPQVEIDVQVNYRAMQITHIPNNDCKYLYHWCSNEDDLMPYINTYGRKLYIDFMRHAIGDAIAASDVDNLWYYRDFGQSASSEVPIMATAIALDENKTPAKDFNSKVFTLKPIPETPEGRGEIRIDENKLGASYFWYEYTMAENTPYMFWKPFSREQAEYYQTQASADELAALALSLNEDGWGLKNDNYSYNEQTGEYGKIGTGRDIWFATPDTEYVIGYIARNRAQELSKVKFTAPFRTKPLVTNNPSACMSDAEMTVTSNGRTSITISFTYDYEKHAGVRFQYIEPVLDGAGQPSSDASRETFISYFGFGLDSNTQGMAINNWNAEPIGKDSFTMAGMTPGTKYRYAYMCEDWNGVVGEVKFAEATTAAIEGGNNPVATIDAQISNGVINFTFQANDDTESMQYMIGTIDTDNDVLGIKHIGDDSYYTADEYMKKWTTACINLGLPTYNLTATLSNSANEKLVALCIPFGANSVRGKLVYKIWDGTAFKTLSDYYPGYTPTTAGEKLVMAPAHTSKAVHASQLRVQKQVERKPRAKHEVEERYVLVDMHRLGKHPHATMQ